MSADHIFDGSGAFQEGLIERLNDLEETLTELQEWLQQTIDRNADFLEHGTGNALGDAFYKGSLSRDQQILNWLETKRSGNVQR